MDTLCHEMELRGFVCWYDNKMTDLTKEGMAAGVKGSMFVILFLSHDVLTRPYVQFLGWPQH